MQAVGRDPISEDGAGAHARSGAEIGRANEIH
jgi:hypothetical protein